MGLSWICPKCEDSSDECSKQYTDTKNANFDAAERAWMRKLKCLDIDHSKANGLTADNFNKLAESVERQLYMKKIELCPNKADIIECLKNNPECMINCKQQMDEFIDCIDTFRINAIKRKIDESRRAEKRKQADSLFG